MKQALVTASLNYNVSIASEFPSGEAGDISQEANPDSNAFGMMLVELAGDRTSQRQGSRAEDKAVTIQTAGNEELIPTSRILAQDTAWRDNGRYTILPACTIDSDTASRDQERDSDKSTTRETIALSDLKVLPLSMADAGISAAAGQSDAEMERQTAPVSLNKDIDPDINTQTIKRTPDMISFAEIENHLPPLIKETVRDIAAGLNADDSREIDRSARLDRPSAPIKILKINLHPVELGALAVRIRMSGTTMHVEIHAETRATTSLLTDVRQKILENLNEAGADITTADLKIGFAPAPPAGESGASSQRANPESNSGSQQQGGFARQQSDRRQGEVPHGVHRDEDSNIAFGDSLHDGLFI
jgi:flagellar hook-length control protein FliK